MQVDPLPITAYNSLLVYPHVCVTGDGYKSDHFRLHWYLSCEETSRRRPNNTRVAELITHIDYEVTIKF